jgi:hypothetical protein
LWAQLRHKSIGLLRSLTKNETKWLGRSAERIFAYVYELVGPIQQLASVSLKANMFFLVFFSVAN